MSQLLSHSKEIFVLEYAETKLQALTILHILSREIVSLGGDHAIASNSVILTLIYAYLSSQVLLILGSLHERYGAIVI